MTQAETQKTFEDRLAERLKMMTRCLTPARRARLRWDECIHLARGFLARRMMREDAAAAGEAPAPPHLDGGAPHPHSPPHPLLVSLVRVLARAAAEADLTAQRSNDRKGDPA